MYESENNNNMKYNKIVNNSYNTGEIKYEAFNGKMKVADRVNELYEDQLSENLIDIRLQNDLAEEMYILFLDSPFYEKYKNTKKIEKSDLLDIYYYFKEILIKKNLYSLSQIFIAIAEFFQINFNQLHKQIGVLDKELLLKEMTKHNNKFNVIKVKKLF